MNAMINSRPQSSCLFSDSWINGMWAPRLPSNPFIERIINNTLFDYSCLSLFLSLKRSEHELSSFLSQKNMKKNFFTMVVRIKWQKPIENLLCFYLYLLLGFPYTNWTVKFFKNNNLIISLQKMRIFMSHKEWRENPTTSAMRSTWTHLDRHDFFFWVSFAL